MATPDEVVFRDHASGVHAIFAGDVSLIANTAERYARLRMLLSTLSKHYDLVVIDTPPVLAGPDTMALAKSEEHTSELQSLMRISYAVFCLKKKKQQTTQKSIIHTANNKTNTKYKRVT